MRAENMETEAYQPQTVYERMRYQRMRRCANCGHWILESGPRMAWGRCAIDGDRTKWTCPCNHINEFKLSNIHRVQRRRPRK